MKERTGKTDAKKKGILGGYSAMEKKNFLFVALLLAFPIIQFIIFYLVINIESFKYAFTDELGNASLKYITQILEDFSANGNNLFKALGRSFVTWGVGNLIVFPISILFTYALFKRVAGEMFFRVLFFLPGIIGTVVLASIYIQITTMNGPLQIILEKGFGIDLGEDIRALGLLSYEGTSFLMVLIFGVWCTLGGNVVVLTGAMTRIPPDIFEYGRIEGIGVWTEFFKVVLPLIVPTISTLFIFSLAGIFTADNGTFLLFPDNYDGAAKTMGYVIFLMSYNVSRGAEIANRPAALGFIVTLATFPVVLIVRWVIEKFTDDVEF